jgi:hypothetical protein
LGDVAFKLTAGFSEVEEMRRKINRRPREETWSVEDIGVESSRAFRGSF